MIQAIKAEFRKLLTVRSTYWITFFVLAVVAFISFYVEGWRLKPMDLAVNGQLANDVTGALTLSIFGAIIAILLMTHEYRYNTIIYSLTNSNNRSKVLFAKIVAVSTYAIALTAVICVISPVMSYLGVHAAGHTLSTQIIPYKQLIWESLFYGWSYGLAGLLLAALIRSQVGAIVALFVIPTAIEHLLAQLLNTKAAYLPFMAQSAVVGDHGNGTFSLSPAKGALVFSIYLVIGYIVAWILFLRRDAN